jgi:HSP20 family protein
MAMCKVSSSGHFMTHSVPSAHDGGAKPHWVPNTDVYVTDNGLIVKVELAGMRSENLEITVEGNRLRISGNRPDVCRAAKCSFLVMAISYGEFESELEMPAGYDLSHAKAAYLNGFLRIDVPAAVRTSKHTKVPIAEGNSSLI